MWGVSQPSASGDAEGNGEAMTERARLAQLVKDFPDSTLYARKLLLAKDGEDYSDRQISAPLVTCTRCQRSFYATGRTPADPPFICLLCRRDSTR